MESSEKLTPQKQGFTLPLSMAVLSSTMGMFTFGYNTGVINAPKTVITSFYNSTYFEREGEVDMTLVDQLWSTTVAMFAAGGMIGGLAGGWWGDKFGRKRGMMINSVICIIAGLLMGLSEPAKSYEMLIIGRFVVGFSCGLYTGLTPMYNSEIAPPSIRGAVGMCNQLGVTIALLVSQVLGLDSLLGTTTLWPLLLALTAVAPLIQLITLPFLPESPSYLYAHNRAEGALEALKFLRGTEDVSLLSSEIDAIKQEVESSDGEESMSFIQVFRTGWLRKPLFIAIIMHLSQQLSGINCIFYYSTTLFEKVGLSSTDAQYATLGVGGIMVVMTFVTVPLMDVAGRRSLHLIGLGGIFVCSVVFTITFTLQDKIEDNGWLKYVAIASALTFVMFFALGPGSIPWMIVAELFPQASRGVAVSIAVLVNWFANFVVAISFDDLLKALGTLIFIPFIFFVFIFFIILCIVLPETKNKTIDEISALFNRPTAHNSPTAYNSVSHSTPL